MKLKQEEEKYTKQILRLKNEKDKFDEKIDTKIQKIKDKRFKIELRLSHLIQLREKNCKHRKEYGRKKWANMRDDASFSTYVGCGNCGAVLWDECYGDGGDY